MRGTLAIVLLASAPVWAAEDAGRALNWETLGSPTYTNPALSSSDAEKPTATFVLPTLVPDQGTQTLSQSPRLLLKSIELTGVTVFSDAEIASITGPYENRSVTTEDLQAVRLNLSRLYADAGYINSGVVIPEQNVQDGVVHMRAIEGSLADVRIDGKPRLRERYIEGRLDRFIDNPLNVSDVQTALQYLQRDRVVEHVNARLVPGDHLGESVLHVAVDEVKRFELMLSADNHGSSSVGSERGWLTFGGRNLTGLGDVARVSTTLSDGTNEGDASFAIPLNRWNTSFQAYFSLSDAEIVEDAFKALDIESETRTWGVAISQPVVDTTGNAVSLTAGFEAKRSESRLAGVRFSFSPGAVDGESQTSVALTGFDWINRGNNHHVNLRSTWRRGLDVLDATIFDPADATEALFNPTGADGEFDMILTQALFLYRLNRLPFLGAVPDRGQLVFRSTAQISDDPLMSLEKIAIGGANTVRGYPENLLVRDNGFAATLELQIPVWGYRAEAHPLNLVIAPFVDFGASWDDSDTDTISDVRDTNSVRHIVGAGVGLLWQPFAGLQAQVYWGDDVEDNFEEVSVALPNGASTIVSDDPRDSSDDDDLQHDGIHFSVSYRKLF